MTKFKFVAIVCIMALFSSCSSSSKKSSSSSSSSSSSNCNNKNIIEKYTFKGENLKFDVKHAVCDMIQGATYRIILTNFDDPDKKSKEIKEGEIKIVLALTKPVSGKFKKGTYTYGNDGKKENKVALSLYNGNARIKTFNLSNVKNAGKIEVDYLDRNEICGTAHLFGQKGSELKVEFNAKKK